jgi:hypothetical protein
MYIIVENNDIISLYTDIISLNNGIISENNDIISLNVYIIAENNPLFQLRCWATANQLAGRGYISLTRKILCKKDLKPLLKYFYFSF